MLADHNCCSAAFARGGRTLDGPNANPGAAAFSAVLNAAACTAAAGLVPKPVTSR
jgi:hypothetical protein